jgi:hypothetical protein
VIYLLKLKHQLLSINEIEKEKSTEAETTAIDTQQQQTQ